MKIREWHRKEMSWSKGWEKKEGKMKGRGRKPE